MLRRELTDVQWERISDLVPGKASDCGSTGRDNRLFVDAVLWIARTSSPWRDLPDAFGNWNSVYVRFSRWAKQGAWESLYQGLGGRSGLRIPDHRFNHCAGTSTCVRRKRGTQNQAIGRSRGGLTSKVHIAVDGLGNPLRFILTGGQVGDVTQVEELIADVAGANLIADTAYDADHLRARLNDAGIVAVIPSNPSRAQAIPYDAELYKERHLVECYINKIKHFRRIATRYEKTATAYMAMLFLVGAIIWLR